MPVNSKQKGAQYERDIARKLSKWVSGSDDTLIFWRNVHSGTTGTVQKRKGKSDAGHTGDFTCTDLRYSWLTDTFFIDSKALGNVHLMLINPDSLKSSQLFKQWRKVCDEASTSNKIPMMPVKATNDRKIPEFILFPDYITFDCDVRYIQYIYPLEYKNYNNKLVLQNDFFSTINAKAFYNLSRNSQ